MTLDLLLDLTDISDVLSIYNDDLFVDKHHVIYFILSFI